MAALLSLQRCFARRLPIRFLHGIKELEVLSVGPQLFTLQGTPQRKHNFTCLQCVKANSYISTRHISCTTKLYAEVSILCPAFAESVTEGDIRWIKAVGDAVAVDEVVAEIETDKTTVEVISTQAGVVTSLLVEDGSAVRPKMELCKLDSDASAAPAAPPAEAAAPEPAAPAPTPPAATSAPTPSPPAAATAGLIPTTLPPVAPLPTAPMTSTPVSQIKVTPLAASGASTPPTHGARTQQRVKMSRMRLRIAQRLKEAQNSCAMLTTFNEVDMTNIMALRNRYKEQFQKEHGIKLGFMSAFIKASAYALKAEPAVNAVIDDTEIVYRDFVDISVAVATPKGLMVPVLRNVETMNYMDIEKALNDLGEKARAGALAIEDMDGGTFTVSNGGVFGSMFGTPIINPPQSAILGMHGTFDRPVAVAGKVEIRPMMYIALTYDHRLIDGREAVLFLKRIKSSVEDPAIMLLDL